MFLNTINRSFFSLARGVGLAGLTLLFASCTNPRGGQRLPRLMEQRLAWMDEVAQVKQARSLPVTDRKREAELLLAMERAGAAHGLPAPVVRAFFSGQMEAAKLLQREWLSQHAGQIATQSTLPDLQGVVRPALDRLGHEMLAALSQARHEQLAPQSLLQATQQRLSAAGYSAAVVELALKGLAQALE